MSIDALLTFVRERDRTRYDVFAQQGAEPTEADVGAFERHVGFAFTPDVRELLLHSLGGLFVEASEAVWPRAVELEVGPSWTFLRGVQVFSLSPEAPDFLDMRRALDALRREGVEGLVPVLRVLGDADRWCVDAHGRVVLWRHDEPDAPPEPAGVGLTDLLVRELAELDARVERRLALGRG
ncbi:SMI1/KNR4 family protein [Nocardioides litoris]|uniref:SMI1/KNR4 family protein n=1 Tax=Nocardioides litoris TaxID=1926648 RepID=UPI001120326B|nr:SMI1/KNR4 family protein [Nocardioides litoris]